MNHLKQSARVSLGAISALCALVACWQFYLFVQFRNVAGQLDPQGGGLYLGLAVLMVLVACVAGAGTALSVVMHDKDEVIRLMA